jgi:hypothetical protein
MMRSSDGNTEKLTGCRIYIETSRMMMEIVILRLMRRSSATVGIGSTMTSSIPITAMGTIKWTLLRIWERFGIAALSATLISFFDLLLAWRFCCSEIYKGNYHAIREVASFWLRRGRAGRSPGSALVSILDGLRSVNFNVSKHLLP